MLRGPTRQDDIVFRFCFFFPGGSIQEVGSNGTKGTQIYECLILAASHKYKTTLDIHRIHFRLGEVVGESDGNFFPHLATCGARFLNNFLGRSVIISWDPDFISQNLITFPLPDCPCTLRQKKFPTKGIPHLEKIS